MKKNTLIITMLIFTASLALSQDKKKDFSSWDANADGKVDQNEFMLNTTKFDKWDDNDDNKLSADEFQNAIYKLVDKSNDDQIDRSEWQKLNDFVQAHKDKKALNLDDWDTNKNGMVDKNEFNAKLTGEFNNIDENNDNFLSKTELYEVMFKWWDMDDSGDISQTEYDQVKSMTKDDKSLMDKVF